MRKIFIIPIFVVLSLILFFSIHNPSLVHGISIQGQTIILESNQQLVGNTQTEITIDPNRPQLVVTDSHVALATINIPSGAINATINFAMLVSSSGDTNSVTMPNTLTINQFSGTVPSTQVIIPACATIQGPSTWDGVFDLPTVKPNTSVTIPAQTEKGNAVNQVMEIGFGSRQLTLSCPAKIVYFGSAGRHIGFTYSGPLVEITKICQNNALPSGSNECKTDIGSDLVVYTNHFSNFATWGSPSAPPSSGSSGGGSTNSGGGGGGGGYGVGYNPPPSGGKIAPPQGGVEIYQVSWDVCRNNTATIVAGTSANSTPFEIWIHGTLGITKGVPAISQPYTEQNKVHNTNVLLYTVPLSPGETFFEIIAGDSPNTVKKSVTISACSGTLVIFPLPWEQQSLETPTNIQKPPEQQPMEGSSSMTTVPEFPIGVPILLASFISLIVFYRIIFRK